jgi:hypothetical protein
VCLLLASPAAEAAQIALAWDANPEPDVAGYIVEYGPSSAPFTLSANVGNVTTWTLTSAVGGITYVFRVIAYNTHGEASDASDPISTIATTPGGPTLTPDRSSLNFALRGTTLMTAAQTVRLTQAGPAGTTAWAASPSAAWVRVSPAAGAGSGAFSVSIDAATAPASGGVATVTIAAEGAFNVINPIQVTLSRITTSSTVAPIGAIDSPVDHTTGVTGSIAITGWALDDVDVTRVRIYRDPVSSETPGQPVYIGDAVRVADARPDIAAAFPAYPANYRGGWGYLALTNMLPNLGNGTFRLLVYAEDGDGHATLLGTTTITCTNATAAQPFGAIDTPAPGETVGGGIYTTFGWVLSRGPRRADIPGGGNVTVLIDGNPVGTPTGWAARSDITGLFPASEYPGVSTALAALAFDTTTLSNGLHTMAWIVTDDQGNSSGIGSRYFSVFNSSGAALATQSSSLRATYSVDAKVATAPSDPRTVEARRGFALDAPFRQFEPDESGRVVLQAEELDRVEVKVPGAVSGYLVSNSELRPLPIGSTLRDGVFTWQSGPGFVGPYDLVFLRGDRTATRQDVRIVLNPKGSNRVGPQVVVDFARDIVAGWAADLDSPSGTGIDMIHVWAYPHAGGAPVFLGQAAYGGERTDVGAFYGDRFLRSGFGLHVKDLPPGAYDVAVFAWSVARGAWLPATVARVTR